MTKTEMAAPPCVWGGVDELGGKSTRRPMDVLPGELGSLFWKTGVTVGRGRLDYREGRFVSLCDVICCNIVCKCSPTVWNAIEHGIQDDDRAGDG